MPWSENQNSTELTTSDNVGIGSGSPATRLHVEGGSDQESTLVLRRSDNNKFGRLGVGASGVALDFDSSSYFVIQNNAGIGPGGYLNGTELFRVTADGKVEIPTTGTLEVDGFVGFGIAPLRHRVQLGPIYDLRIDGGVAGGDLRNFFSFGGNGVFGIDAPNVPNGRFVVLDSGNVGIGTSAPTSLLEVAGNMEVIGVTKTEDLNVGRNITVGGDVILSGADCAEEFDAVGSESPGPGTVVVIDEEGALRESRDAYDKKVAGVVSCGGEYRHGLVLDKRSTVEGRVPVALVGKVYCKVDAKYSPIDVGDLLTTSPTVGHAMKATDPVKAFGCVIGKALRRLEQGCALIPILVALQ
jgi:hypothetical protein